MTIGLIYLTIASFSLRPFCLSLPFTQVNDITEGEARRYFEHAIALREAIRFLRSSRAGYTRPGADLEALEAQQGAESTPVGDLIDIGGGSGGGGGGGDGNGGDGNGGDAGADTEGAVAEGAVAEGADAEGADGEGADADTPAGEQDVANEVDLLRCESVNALDAATRLRILKVCLFVCFCLFVVYLLFF